MNTENKTYNGWTNYETWAVALWMDNDEGSQEFWHETAESVLDNTRDQEDALDEDSATSKLEDLLREYHEEQLPELTGFASDLLNAAMSEVNWREIARHLVEAVIEENK